MFHFCLGMAMYTQRHWNVSIFHKYFNSTVKRGYYAFLKMKFVQTSDILKNTLVILLMNPLKTFKKVGKYTNNNCSRWVLIWVLFCSRQWVKVGIKNMIMYCSHMIKNILVKFLLAWQLLWKTINWLSNNSNISISRRSAYCLKPQLAYKRKHPAEMHKDRMGTAMSITIKPWGFI